MNYINEGLKVAEKFCEELGLPFKSLKTDLNDSLVGIDCYIDQKATDVKITKEIIVCRVDLDTFKFTVRHPFRLNSKASHYLIYDKTNKKYNFQEIKYYLLQNFFKNYESLKFFRTFINELDNTKIKINNIKPTFLKIKTELKDLIRQDVRVNFIEPSDEMIAKFNMKDIYLKLRI